MQFLTLPVEQFAGSTRGLHGISKIRKPQKPHCMFEVFFAANVKSGPA
jgi:hypothetical protein